jgi:multisubunit Na+/H+ antiporter MnhF subunit
VNVWFVGATILLLALVPVGWALVRGEILDALVALELAGTVVTLILLLISEGFKRNSYYTLPLVLAFTNFVGVLIFVRFLGDREL